SSPAFRICALSMGDGHLARIGRVMTDRRGELDALLQISGNEHLIPAPDCAGAERSAKGAKRLQSPRNHEAARSAVVEAMNQSALAGRIASIRGLRKSRDHRVHHGVALVLAKRMTRHRSGF